MFWIWSSVLLSYQFFEGDVPLNFESRQTFSTAPEIAVVLKTAPSSRIYISEGFVLLKDKYDFNQDRNGQ